MADDFDLPSNPEVTEDVAERTATHLSDQNDPVDVETAWRLPER